MTARADCQVEALIPGHLPMIGFQSGVMSYGPAKPRTNSKPARRGYRVPRPGADGILVAAREPVVAVVRTLERILAGVGDGENRRPRSGRTTTFVTASEHTADGSAPPGGVRPTSTCSRRNLDRLLRAERA